jgi:poly(3-hydroxybutyrate) depolymerase
MKKLLFSFFTAFFILNVNAQSPCTDGRYASDVFSDFNLTSDIEFGQNATWTGGQYTLKLDFYEPQGDTETERPLLIWVHGGSFIGGDKTDYDMEQFSERFAKKGYTCASINYRLGFFPIDSANAVKAVVRATQDLRAAIRFFYKDKENANIYKIDTNKIFIGGSSAGAITALHVGYLDDACEIQDYLSQSTIQSMGGIEGTSGNPGYSSNVQGVINGCGALARYSWMEAGDVPLCSFHGTNDGTVTYNRGIVNPGVPLMYLDGSRMLHDRACAVGIEEYFYTYEGAGHVPYAGDAGLMNLTVNFIRDFLVLQLGCDETPLQPENEPSEEAVLYAIDDCDGNPVDEICAPANLIEVDQVNFKIYPNPSNGLISIASDFDFDKVRIFNIQGKELLTRQGGSNGLNIDLSEFENGSYIIQLEMKNGARSKTSRFELIQ